MSSDILSVLKEDMSGFSKGQKRIAQYILESYDKAAFMTANKLAQNVGVSESTVVRFAVDLGFDGYPDMQKAMQEMVLNRLTSVQRIEVANDRMKDQDVISTVFHSDIDKLRQTEEKIVSVGPEDVVIAFSFPRYSASTTKGARYCCSAGATVIGITDSKLSPLGQCCDHVLVAKSDMVSLVDSLVAPLSMINALIVAIAAKKEREVAHTFETLERIWDEYNVYEKQAVPDDQ